MKKILTIVLIGIVLISGFGAAVSLKSHTDMRTIQEHLGFSDPLLSVQSTYLSVHISETTSYATEPGNPMLPVYTKLFTFPLGTVIGDVSFSTSTEQTIELSAPVLPAAQLQPISSSLPHSQTTIREKNSAIYNSKTSYPVSRLTYQIGAGLSGNTRVIFVSVQYYPLLYQPKQNTLIFTPDVTLTITYTPSTTPQVLSDDTKLLLIAPEEFASALQPLIDHKNLHGVETSLITLEWIADHATGRDLPEQIKYTMKAAIENDSISSVLLVGGVDKIPIRRSYVSFWHWDEEVITDLYYSDIYNYQGGFSSWDTNHNDQFGESSDQVDHYPDVHLGRLACASVQEVTLLVDKIIHYETETYGSDWFNTMIFIGGNTFPWSPGNDGEDNNEILMGIMSEFTPELIWTSLGNFNRLTISQTISDGAGFIDYSGHGFEHGMGTYTPSGLQMKYYFTRYIQDLQNGYKLPVMFFDACLTAKIDYVLQDLLDYKEYFIFNILATLLNINTSQRLPCYAWAFVNHENGGAIATIGATRTAYGGIDSGAGKMSIEFFSAYETSDYLGEMMTQMQNGYITDVPDDSFTVEEFILLGDPTLKIGGYPS
jgi:hypothetical protein